MVILNLISCVFFFVIEFDLQKMKSQKKVQEIFAIFLKKSTNRFEIVKCRHYKSQSEVGCRHFERVTVLQ